jgi:hypothetical protein
MKPTPPLPRHWLAEAAEILTGATRAAPSLVSLALAVRAHPHGIRALRLLPGPDGRGRWQVR